MFDRFRLFFFSPPSYLWEVAFGYYGSQTSNLQPKNKHMTIGFIGLGIMGSRMAENLLNAGHQLKVYNRSKEKAESLLQKGATWASNPQELAQDVEVLITVLAHPAAVEALALGEAGFLAHLPKGSIWLDSSTVNPSFSRQMAQEAQQRGILFLDGPVGGSKNQAADAQLVFIVGGPEAALETCRPLMETMGQRIVHVGENGMGSSLKIVLNYLLGISMTAFAEGVSLGKALGIPEATLLNVLIGGPVAAPFLARKKEAMETGNYSPEFPMQWMQKDMHLASLTAFEKGIPLPVGNAAKELFQMAVKSGRGEQDFSAVYEYLG
ncbi:MAG: NAD(P)-dependent oxidoreductase [Bacteroidota bacterium]